MPLRFNSLRLWSLVALLVAALTTGTMLRAMQGDAPAATHWSHSAAI